MKKNAKDQCFIHPAFSGCEVYENLFSCSSRNYNCIGIDNYNLQNRKKIDCLNTLANKYSNHLKFRLSRKKQTTIVGRSLGGLIAKEMTYLPEKQEYQKINIILLDTHIRRPLNHHLHYDPRNGGQSIFDFINQITSKVSKEHEKKV